ncbi:hypothetical protein [Halioxenophilus sp. WMMB6]|uniref:hypothetical protein n=1 Tax=Halioxenophilus sp. WMMB6 TaxID=3073815 RepID=UPI00295F471A|nr:hypothetical protein [Halioxenophilus sp. WMMB6]
MNVRILLLALLPLLLTACAGQDKRILGGDNQVELRNMQSRTFETNDQNRVVRTVIATMQDLSFVISNADAELGTVSGMKLDGYNMKMTVTVRQKSENQMLVRANAQYNLKAIEDPAVYQDFFTALEKAMFLTANAVE